MNAKHQSNFKQAYILLLLVGVFLILGSASAGKDGDLHTLAQRAQLKLNALHYVRAESNKIKQFELLLNDEGFLRYRLTYVNGKQEYFSFNIMRFKAIDYLGNTTSGDLYIQTLEDDVIVQTFNDRSGNVDSMATSFHLTLGKVEAEDLVALQQDLLEMKRLLEENH